MSKNFTFSLLFLMLSLTAARKKASKTCNLEHGQVNEIKIKTGDGMWSETTENVWMTVCDGSGLCCRTDLNPDGKKLKKGAVDTFSGSKVLGKCSVVKLAGPLTAVVSKKKDDGWFVDWAEIELYNNKYAKKGTTFKCNFGKWIDSARGYCLSLEGDCVQTDAPGIKMIQVKTSNSLKQAGTKDSPIKIKVCDCSNNCCNATFDNSEKNRFTAGSTVSFRGDDIGTCATSSLEHGDLVVTLEKEKNDGWLLEYVNIWMNRGSEVMCKINTWVDSSAVTCKYNA